MESTQRRVKKIKVKKSRRPSFKSRVNRFLKTGHMSNKWLWNIMIFTIPAILIIGIILVFWFKPLTADWKGGVLDRKDDGSKPEIK